MKIELNKPDACCKIGEEVIFHLNGFGADVKYEIIHDYRTVLDKGVAAGKSVRIIPENPGFILFRAGNSDEIVESGIAVEPEKIVPLTPEAPDFDEYWTEQLERLARIPMNLKTIKRFPLGDSVHAWWNSKWPVFGKRPLQYATQLYEFEAGSIGRPACGFYAMPENAAPCSLPAVLFTHGSGLSSADKYKTFFAAASLGFLSMDISAHGLGNELDRSEYDFEFCNKTHYYDIFGKGLEDRDSMYIAEMYLRHKRALDVLCSIPQWNGRTLIVNGSSQGGALAVACGALDRRVSHLCIGVPAFSDPWHPYLIERFFSHEKLSETARNNLIYIAGCNLSKRIKAKSYWAVAYLDSSCIPSSVCASYNQAGGEKYLYHGIHDKHAFSTKIEWDDWTRFMEDASRENQ